MCRSSESSTAAARLTSSQWRPSSRLGVRNNHRRLRHTREPAMPSRWFAVKGSRATVQPPSVGSGGWWVTDVRQGRPNGEA